MTRMFLAVGATERLPLAGPTRTRQGWQAKGPQKLRGPFPHDGLGLAANGLIVLGLCSSALVGQQQARRSGGSSCNRERPPRPRPARWRARPSRWRRNNLPVVRCGCRRRWLQRPRCLRNWRARGRCCCLLSGRGRCDCGRWAWRRCLRDLRHLCRRRTGRRARLRSCGRRGCGLAVHVVAGCSRTLSNATLVNTARGVHIRAGAVRVAARFRGGRLAVHVVAGCSCTLGCATGDKAGVRIVVAAAVIRVAAGLNSKAHRSWTSRRASLV